MKTIYKYVLSTVQRSVSIPDKAKILSCQAQGFDICLWCEVDADEPIVLRYFEVIGTGWDLSEYSDALNFLATVQLPNGLVYHVFEELQKVGIK